MVEEGFGTPPKPSLAVLEVEVDRGKIISVRVNEDLYNRFQSVVAKNTKVYQAYKTRRLYDYRDPINQQLCQYDKFSIGDLLELAMKDFVEKREDICEIEKK